jgi:hypothetical protein
MRPHSLAAALSVAASAASNVTGGLTFLTFAEGTYDVELGLLNLADSAITPLYTFPGATVDSGFWVESSYVTPGGSSWVSNVQYDANATQGALVEFTFATKAVRAVNATYCWAMFLAADDATGTSILCVADNAMDVPRRKRRPPRGVPTAPPAAHPPVRLRDSRMVYVFRISSLTGAQTTVGTFPAGQEEALDVTYDTKRNLIYCLLSNDVTNANALFTFNVAAGAPAPNPPPVAYDKILYAMQYDERTDGIVAMASTYDDSAQAWNTGFGTVDPATGNFTPVGAVNGTFAALRQFNDIDAIAPSIHTFFFTAFDWNIADTQLYVVGVDVGSGDIVLKTPVRNPFIDISYVPASGAGRR